jgi:DNA invertase Pin-like site-specific DNA recombinase
MVKMDALEARLVALEDQMAGMKAAPPRPVQVEPRQPRPLMAGKRRPPTPITDDIRRQVHDLRADQMTQEAIAKTLGIATSAVSRILDAPRPPR